MASSTDQICRRLKESGVKLTRQRVDAIRVLVEAGRHLSADELLELLRRKGRPASKATVYRLIQVLRSAHLIDVHDFDQRRRVIEPMVGRVHHDHLYCIHCGEITEFSSPEIEALQRKVLQQHRFQEIYHSHKIFGYCRRCRHKRHS